MKRGDVAEVLSDDLSVITAEINAYQRVAGEAIFEIGRRLKHVKENDLTHGQWSKWCEELLGMSRQHAHRFIKVYEELGGSNVTSGLHLGVKVLYEIATLPPAEREKPHTIPSTGEVKMVDEMTVRELREVKKALKQAQQEKELAERRAKQAEQRAQIAQRDAEILRNTLESIEDKTPEIEYRTEYIEVEVEKESPQEPNEKPYGVKLSGEIYNAFDELSEWQKKYSWILTDLEEFRLLVETNPDFAREFNRLNKFWKQMSNAFDSVTVKGVVNGEKENKNVIDAEYVEIL